MGSYLATAAVLLCICSMVIYFSNHPRNINIPPVCIAPETVRISDQQNGTLILKGNRTIDMHNKTITYSYFIEKPGEYQDIAFNRKLNFAIKRVYMDVYNLTITKITTLPSDKAGHLIDAFTPTFYIGSTLKLNIRLYKPGIYSIITDDRIHHFCNTL